MRKVHEKVIGKFFNQETIHTANFSVTNYCVGVDKNNTRRNKTVLYSYALPVAIIDTNGNVFVGDYIRKVSCTTSAQIRALITILNSDGIRYEMCEPKKFEELYRELI